MQEVDWAEGAAAAAHLAAAGRQDLLYATEALTRVAVGEVVQLAAADVVTTAAIHCSPRKQSLSNLRLHTGPLLGVAPSCRATHS